MLFIRPTNPVSHRLARIAFLLACAGALTVGLSGPLHRYLGIEADMAIGVFRYGFYIAAAAIALGLATIVPTRPGDRRRGFVASVLALAIGVAAAWAPINWLLRAREAPRINDVTTDTANPPPLVVTLQYRQNAPNPPAYGGESVASLQKAGYPDIQPIVLKVPPAEAFKKVDAIAAPVSPTAAFKLGEKVDDPLAMYLADIYTVTADLAGIPGISVPCGETKDKLPIGLQILGRHFDESTILRVAQASENAASRNLGR